MSDEAMAGRAGLPRPYYEEPGITIYHADCRDILPLLPKIDLVLTDPPYPTWMVIEYRFEPSTIKCLSRFDCRQYVFWTPAVPFPLTYSGKRIWDKRVGTATQYEEIYERNNASGYKLHRHHSMGCFSSVSARMTGEIISGHPSQKPLKLIIELIVTTEAQLILDPFMGSGTTLVAAKQLGRRAIGIEIEEKYCRIAVGRLRQAVLPLEPAAPESRSNWDREHAGGGAAGGATGDRDRDRGAMVRGGGGEVEGWG